MTPDLAGTLVDTLLRESDEALRDLLVDGAAPQPLTAAELRVLAFLPSHLTFPQIGAALYLSPNTIKTHALSVYRKLGASSRDEAMGKARALGLVEPSLPG